MAQPLPETRLEQIFSLRAGVRLQQFGYDLFGRAFCTVTVPQTGAMMDDYVLGPGDQIIVSLRGQENAEDRVNVDRNGQVALPRINPIEATGRTFGEFRQDLEAAICIVPMLRRIAFVSIGTMRQISVLVTGEVNNPGQRTMVAPDSRPRSTPSCFPCGIKENRGRCAIFASNAVVTKYVVDLYSTLTDSGAPLR